MVQMVRFKNKSGDLFLPSKRSNATFQRFNVLTTNWMEVDNSLCDYVRATLNWKETKKVHFSSFLRQYFGNFGNSISSCGSVSLCLSQNIGMSSSPSFSVYYIVNIFTFPLHPTLSLSFFLLSVNLSFALNFYL